MAFTMTDTSTPYGDPTSLTWDAEEDDAEWYEFGKACREARRKRRRSKTEQAE